MAKVVAIGQPVNEAERLAIAYLRDHLSDAYTIMHNFEIKQGVDIFEIDLAILAPHGVYIVDVKGTHGLVDIYGSKWYPDGRQPYSSPLAKLRQHAKVLKSLICDTHPEKPELNRVHVQAVVLMTAPDASVVDHDGRDGPDVTYLKKCVAYFQDVSRIPSQRLADIRPFLSIIEQSVRGKAKPRSGPLRYRDWQIEERLGGDDHYTEYRAKHVLLGVKGISARLRVYRADPYQDKAMREAEQKRISNAYLAVAHMPSHPNILGAREFFPTEHEDAFVLVTEDIAGMALRQHLRKAGLALTYDQKTRVIHDVLTALAHAHRHKVIHRNLTPDVILVGVDGAVRLVGFDYARVGASRTSTIANDIVDDVDPAYQAPECYRDPAQATPVSDLFSAGIVFYELLTGERPYDSPEHMFDHEAKFPIAPTEIRPDLPDPFNDWLQRLCAFTPDQRFASADAALDAFARIIAPPDGEYVEVPTEGPQAQMATENLNDLPSDYSLGNRFIVQQRLGRPGGFAVAYKVFDTFGDVIRVLKLVTRDRHSVFDRLRQEYRVLVQLPEHPHVVKAIWADRLPDETPYIVFEYVNGLDVRELIQAGGISLEDAVTIGRQAALGLAHLHRHGVYHQDIKPSNLLWTDGGVRILDFNVAVSDRDDIGPAGGTRRYLPPSFDPSRDTSEQDKIDRDLYALGITLYECVTGQYPFAEATAHKHDNALDPRQITGYEDLSQELVAILLKAIAPSRSERFSSADAFHAALAALPRLRREKPKPDTSESWRRLDPESQPARANYNSFVSYLLTLYSQSQRTNAGTRGLDKRSQRTYIPTSLDKRLAPDIFAGKFRLVIISGNAGDGKTAFIQRLERHAESQHVQIERYQNGSCFHIANRTFITNYDGSQDEGERINDDVLLDFFGPFAGRDSTSWPADTTRIIAINEGRLVDFLAEHEAQFPQLARIARSGLGGADAVADIIVINLNLRSVVQHTATTNDSIFDLLLSRITEKEFWAACDTCDLRNRCYVHHNVRTFADSVAGPKAAERLKMLYTITHLRGRLHITLRDLRSALTFMLVGTRDCDDIHKLYRAGTPESRRQILDGFYFNSWVGGSPGSKDRLITLLRDIDVGEASSPDQDRVFDFLAPDARKLSRFTYVERGGYDDELLAKIFEDLPRDFNDKDRSAPERMRLHRDYVAMLRRRQYFERRDDDWRRMLPYRSMSEFLRLVSGTADLQVAAQKLILAINRGEQLSDPAQLGNALALRVRQVERGTIRSYRLFDGQHFAIAQPDARGAQFLEFLPQAVVFQYSSPLGHRAELRINLDIFEMLTMLNDGYRPSVEEMQGLYLSLAVFKNVLATAPYQEVLLTETGHEFYRIRRHEEGTLFLAPVVQERGSNGHQTA